MPNDHPWKRSSDHWQREMDQELRELDSKVEDLLYVRRLVLGDPVEGREGMETRLAQAERRIQKIDLIVVGEEGTHADGILTQLRDLSGDILDLRDDLKQIRQDKSIRVEARRSWLGFWGPIIASSLGAIIAGASLILTNLDKIAHGVTAMRQLAHPNPNEELKAILAEIEAEKPKRGPIIKKRLEALESAAKRLAHER